MNIGVILAAGDSSRFGGYMNKQYLKLNGKEVVYYTISKMNECDGIDKVILVVDKEEYKSKYIENKYRVECVCGGKTRNESIYNVIQYIKKMYKCNKIIFHDSVRPATPAWIFKDFINLLDNYKAVVSCNSINDAMVDNYFNPIVRESFKIVQTPEAFQFNEIVDKIKIDSVDNSIIGQVKIKDVYSYSTDIYNTKITYPDDLFMLEQMMNLDYYSVKHNDNFAYDISKIGNVLLLGASGGVGQTIKNFFEANHVKYFAPSHKELDLSMLSIKNIRDYLKDEIIDCIINCAAIYFDDNAGLVDKFDIIFNVNVKANLVLIEYAKTMSHKINIVMMSSSSSTKGRENLTNYSAAKTALNSIVQSQAEVLAKNDIYINAVIPEKVKTPLIEKLHKTEINDRELLMPNDLINVIMYYSIAKEYGKLIHIRKGV